MSKEGFLLRYRPPLKRSEIVKFRILESGHHNRQRSVQRTRRGMLKVVLIVLATGAGVCVTCGLLVTALTRLGGG